MAVTSAAILLAGMLAEGRFLHWLDSGLGFGAAAPVALIAGQVAEMTGLALLFLTIRHWVSLRWRSFSVTVGFGIAAVVASFAMLLAAGPYGAWPQYFSVVATDAGAWSPSTECLDGALDLWHRWDSDKHCRMH